MTTAEVSPQTSRLRTALAVVLVSVGLLLAPLAVVSSWVRIHLVDTDRFVSTFAPLADDPDVQQFIADEIVTQVQSQVDIPGIVGDVFERDRVRAVAVAGVQSLLVTSAEQAVRSSQFANLWERSLAMSHRNLTSVLSGDSRYVQIVGGDTLTLQIDPIVAAVQARLVAHGLSFLDRVQLNVEPVTIVEADRLATVQTTYRAAVAGGFWLSWISFVLLALGILVANRRRRTLSIAAAAFAAVFVLLAIAVSIGGRIFVDAVSPDPLPSDVAAVIYHQATELAVSSIRVLAVLGGLIALAAWFHSHSRFATAVRAILGNVFAQLRAALDANGGRTGAFGSIVDCLRPFIMSSATVLGLAGLLVFRPVTINAVAWLVILLGILAIALELLSRPVIPSPEPRVDSLA